MNLREFPQDCFKRKDRKIAKILKGKTAIFYLHPRLSFLLIVTKMSWMIACFPKEDKEEEMNNKNKIEKEIRNKR